MLVRAYIVILKIYVNYFHQISELAFSEPQFATSRSPVMMLSSVTHNGYNWWPSLPGGEAGNVVGLL